MRNLTFQTSFELLLLLSRFSHVRLCATPQTAAHQAPLSLGFSRQEHWSGLSFPSPMHESEKWKWSRSVMSDSWWPHGPQPTRLLHPWDFLVKPSDTFSLFVYKCQIPNKKENRSTSCFLCLIMNYPTLIHFYWFVPIVGNNQNRAQNRSTKHIPSLLPQAVGHSSRITNNWRKCTQSGLRCH